MVLNCPVISHNVCKFYDVFLPQLLQRANKTMSKENEWEQACFDPTVFSLQTIVLCYRMTELYRCQSQILAASIKEIFSIMSNSHYL